MYFFKERWYEDPFRTPKEEIVKGQVKNGGPLGEGSIGETRGERSRKRRERRGEGVTWAKGKKAGMKQWSSGVYFHVGRGKGQV